MLASYERRTATIPAAPRLLLSGQMKLKVERPRGEKPASSSGRDATPLILRLIPIFQLSTFNRISRLIVSLPKRHDVVFAHPAGLAVFEFQADPSEKSLVA